VQKGYLTLMCFTKKVLVADLVVFTDGQIYQSSLYFVSSEWKSWTESRRFCTERGRGTQVCALIYVHSALQMLNTTLFYQEFIKKISGGDGVWIGLTDIDMEGRWKWVDGITLTSGFWGIGEPNGQKEENCITSYPTGWYDYPCSDALKWICEKKFKNE
uniref:C-type lectin domain-containing protein n=1 Tax=Cyprinus carpio TaxID=7962 RepID=A0A8C1UFX1_CYPCA